LIARATNYGVSGGATFRICSAEDLIVLKAFAARPQDWLDIEGVISRSGSALDRGLIVEELKPLVELKEEPEIMARLVGLLESG
jgi:hypothetical protein